MLKASHNKKNQRRASSQTRCSQNVAGELLCGKQQLRSQLVGGGTHLWRAIVSDITAGSGSGPGLLLPLCRRCIGPGLLLPLCRRCIGPGCELLRNHQRNVLGSNARHFHG